jgi:hypothetical protein
MLDGDPPTFCDQLVPVHQKTDFNANLSIGSLKETASGLNLFQGMSDTQ